MDSGLQPGFFVALRSDAGEQMKAIRGCKAEAAIQDIGMVRYAPQRSWTWIQMVHELCRCYE